MAFLNQLHYVVYVFSVLNNININVCITVGHKNINSTTRSSYMRVVVNYLIIICCIIYNY